MFRYLGLFSAFAVSIIERRKPNTTLEQKQLWKKKLAVERSIEKVQERMQDWCSRNIIALLFWCFLSATFLLHEKKPKPPVSNFSQKVKTDGLRPQWTKIPVVFRQVESKLWETPLVLVISRCDRSIGFSRQGAKTKTFLWKTTWMESTSELRPWRKNSKKVTFGAIEVELENWAPFLSVFGLIDLHMFERKKKLKPQSKNSKLLPQVTTYSETPTGTFWGKLFQFSKQLTTDAIFGSFARSRFQRKKPNPK